jgi:hypothetical protein
MNTMSESDIQHMTSTFMSLALLEQSLLSSGHPFPSLVLHPDGSGRVVMGLEDHLFAFDTLADAAVKTALLVVFLFEHSLGDIRYWHKTSDGIWEILCSE